MKKTLFTLLILLLCNTYLFSLGAFNLISGNNRSDLNWFEIDTGPVKIIYNNGLYNTALRAAAIADSTYSTLTKTFDIVPKNQILIYISDQDLITNGAALLDHYIFIWVDSNDFVKLFTGNQKWLEKVIPHEMVHWFVFYTIKDWLSTIMPITQLTFPGNLHEGYAMFFSGEPWGYNRGDRFLRTYSFAENNKETDWYWFGNFMYSSGFSFVKYVAEFYGEDSLVELLKYRGKSNLYDFDKAFKEVFNMPFSQVYDSWSRYIQTWYYGEAYVQKLNHSDTFSSELSINAVTQLEPTFQIKDFVIKEDNIVALVRLNKQQQYDSLIHGKIIIDSLAVNKFHIEEYRIIENSVYFNEMDISQNGKYVVYSRLARHDKGRVAPMITLYCAESRKKFRFGEGDFPTVNNEGDFYFQSTTNIMFGSKDSNISTFLPLLPDNQIVDLKISPNGKYLLATIFDKERDFLLTVLDTDNQDNDMIRSVYQLHSMPQHTLWKDDSNIAVMIENENNFKLELLVYNIETDEVKYYDSPPYNIAPKLLFDYDDGLSVIGFSEIHRARNTIGKVDFPEKSNADNTITPQPINYYNRWIYSEPIYKIPDVIIPYDYMKESKYSSWKNIRYRMGFGFPTGNGLTGMVVLSEPLGKHVINAVGLFPLFRDNHPYWMIDYINSTLFPTLSFSAIRTDWFAGISNEKIITNKLELYSVKAYFPVNFRHRPFDGLNYNLGLSYYDFKLQNRSAQFDDRYDDENMFIGTLGMNYNYNLFWRNSMYHPVRLFDADISFDIADESLGMQRDYQQLKVYTDVAVAPWLYGKINGHFTIRNRSSYRLAQKDPLLQFMPGVDDSEFIFIGGKPAFSRMYLRGYNELIWSKEMFATQNEITYKLIDGGEFSLDAISLISASYQGVSLWYDYTKVSQIVPVVNDDTEEKSFEAIGWEFKSAWNILGIPTLHKFGQAYDVSGKKLDFYYILEIPIFHF